jgi:hypothetical protein
MGQNIRHDAALRELLRIEAEQKERGSNRDWRNL